MAQGSANFVGRQYELTKLREKLQKPGTVAISAVSGMGGVGKTELATQYARKHEVDYSGGICWLNARESNLAAEIVQFAQLYMKLEVPQQDLREKPLSLTEQVAWCWQNWQPSEGLVLVVLDDVTYLGSFRELLPKTNRFRVLMTTRLRNLDSNIQEITLDVLSPEEALQLLKALVGERRLKREAKTAEQLCEWLGYLPLGLEMVGRYLAKKPPNWTLTKMLQRLKAQRLEDEAINRHQQQLQQTLSTAQQGVKAAFELSWLELEEMTQRVAELLSLFAPDIFTWKWVESATSFLNWTSSDIETANEQLYERHLIQWVEDTEDSYNIHPLIREFLQAKLTTSEQADELKHSFAATFVAIAQEIPDSPTQELIKSVKDAMPHLAELVQNLTDAVSDENLILAFVGLGRFYEGQGLYALAEPWYEQCVSAVQTRLGEEHPSVAFSFNNLAYIYQCQGRYEEAEFLHKQALEMQKKLLGNEHLDVAESLNCLGLLYTDKGRYVEAELVYVQALEIRQHLLGTEHQDIADSLNNLALLYDAQGKDIEVESLLIQALEMRRHLLGNEHPRVGTSLNNLAYCYNSQGFYTKAEPLYLEALELSKRLLGEEHTETAASYNNLAYLYVSQERYSEAEPLFDQALKINQKVLGEKHPNVATSLNNLASLYDMQGRYSEAEPLYIQALEMRKRLLGENNHDVAISLNNLAKFYYLQHQFAKAKPLYVQALAILKMQLGDEHPITIKVSSNLEQLYSELESECNENVY